MEKDARIRSLVSHLERALGSGSFVVNDKWEADLLAIGIGKPSDSRILAYVLALDRPDHFAVILEAPPLIGSDLSYREVGHFPSVHRDDATRIIEAHLAGQWHI